MRKNWLKRAAEILLLAAVAAGIVLAERDPPARRQRRNPILDRRRGEPTPTDRLGAVAVIVVQHTKSVRVVVVHVVVHRERGVVGLELVAAWLAANTHQSTASYDAPQATTAARAAAIANVRRAAQPA